MTQSKPESGRKLTRKEKHQLSRSVPKSMDKGIQKSLPERYAFALLGLLVLVVFGNTLSNQYVLDDFSVIKENFLTTRGISGLTALWKTSYRYGYMSIQDGLYRPLTMSLFALQWEFFPDKPFVGHLINLLLLTGGLIMLYKLLVRLFPANALLPFLAASLFAIHPIHTEVVANIKSADELLSFLFGISALYFISKKSGKSALWAFLCILAGMFSKEGSVAFTGFIPAFYLVGLIDKKQALAGLGIFVGATVLYLACRHAVLKDVVGLQSVSLLDNPLAGSGFGTRLFSAGALLLSYLWQLIFPLPLIYDYSYPALLPSGTGDWSALSGWMLALLCTAFALLKGKKYPIASLSWWIFLAGFALYSNVPILIGAMRAERFIYLSSLGFSLASAYAILLLNKKAVYAVAALILVSYGTLSFARNGDWYNNETLYRTDLRKQSESAKVYYYLGNELIKTIGPAQKDTGLSHPTYREGIAMLKKSIQRYPGYAEAITQIGVGYYKLNLPDSAARYFYASLAINPRNAVALSNLGSVLFNQGKYTDAISVYKDCLESDPNFVDGWLNLGSCYGMLAAYDDALEAFDHCLKLRPDHPKALEFKSMTIRLMNEKKQ